MGSKSPRRAAGPAKPLGQIIRCEDAPGARAGRGLRAVSRGRFATVPRACLGDSRLPRRLPAHLQTLALPPPPTWPTSRNFPGHLPRPPGPNRVPIRAGSLGRRQPRHGRNSATALDSQGALSSLPTSNTSPRQQAGGCAAVAGRRRGLLGTLPAPAPLRPARFRKWPRRDPRRRPHFPRGRLLGAAWPPGAGGGREPGLGR